MKEEVISVYYCTPAFIYVGDFLFEVENMKNNNVHKITITAIMGAIGFVLMLGDKRMAQKNLWRIPEIVLMGSALVGGSVGALAGMYTCRHKTKHLKFTLGSPVILALQIIGAIILFA